MSAILSLSGVTAGLWAAGPDGLLRYQDGKTTPVLQPQADLYCCAATEAEILVGGGPHCIAFSTDSGAHWQSAYVSEVSEAALCIAPDPRYLETGVILAGTAGGGLLRSEDRGRHWSPCNYGLENFTILSLAWAPVAGADAWPRWEVVFAATEEGLYRSPNGGLGWRRCTITEGVFLSVMPSPRMHQDGLVLAGTEHSGLWRSCDGGRHFEQVPDSPQQINALVATEVGWFLSDYDGLYRSADGMGWVSVPHSRPSLAMLTEGDKLWLGTDDGIDYLSLKEFS